jgi:peptidoglycan hydrolase-like protein with peptidoglycan-binding domain
MQQLLVGLMVSLLWLLPVVLEAGQSTTGEQRPEQAKLFTKDEIQKVQERLRAEGVDPGPVDGTMSPRTQAALRHYQEKQGLPITGVADQATLEKLQIEIAPGGAGAGEGGAGGR